MTQQQEQTAYTQVMPSAVEIEEAILGAILLEKDAYWAVSDILSPESFYRDSHGEIFRAFATLTSEQKPVDLLTTMEELKRTKRLDYIGGPAYLAELSNKVASSANIEHHARVVQQKYIRRLVIRTGHEAISRGHNDAYDDLAVIDFLEKELFQLTGNVGGRAFQDSRSIIKKRRARIKELRENPDALLGTPSGFSAFDRITKGFLPTRLYILAARPGMGKSALAKSFMRRMSVTMGIPTALFTLEMSAEEFVDRVISEEAHLPINKVKDPRECNDRELYELDQAEEHVEKAPFWVDDTPGLSITMLRSKARRLVREHGVKVIFVDYLQLMTGDSKYGSREEEVSKISRALKALAKELEISVVALSQLSRAVETRGGIPRPKLSDLRESGAIEQDADFVGFLFRPEYYGILEDENGDTLDKGLTELIIAKQRDGSLCTIDFTFVPWLTMFRDVDQFEELPEIINTPAPPPSGDDDLPF